MAAKVKLDEARAVLAEVFGYEDFRAGQAEAVGGVLSGRDVVVLLPTGAGKSLCFQVPAITLARKRRGPTLVVSPLIALMADQVGALTGQGVRAALVNSHQSESESQATLKAFAQGKVDLLYVSPERAAQRAFQAVLAKRKLGLIAIDEAHCVSQWGHDFRPEYTQLAALRALSNAPMIAVTATATPRVLTEIAKHLHLVEPLVVRGDFSRPNLAFSVEAIPDHATRLLRLVALLDEAGMRRALPGKTIVYCSTRTHTEKVAKALASQGFAARHYHAGRTKEARETAQHAFGTGKLRVLVATNAFGMGIDFPDVRLVVHYQTPGSLEAYYQEAGRAGRDKGDARCVMFFGAADLVTQRRIDSGGAASLDAIERYALATECREQIIAAHFGVSEPLGACGRCDVCTGTVAEGPEQAAPLPAAEALTPADIAVLLAAVGELSRPAGKTNIARALRGSRAKGLNKCGLLKISQHGALKARQERAIVEAIERCLESGQLVRKGSRYPTVWLPGKPVRQARDKDAEPRTPKAPKISRRHYSPLRGALERFRKNKARQLQWKVYMVLQKRTMDALATLRPRTLRELDAVPGLGQAKIERFGPELLQLVREHRE